LFYFIGDRIKKLRPFGIRSVFSFSIMLWG
jgi:hypothetical protein